MFIRHLILDAMDQPLSCGQKGFERGLLVSHSAKAPLVALLDISIVWTE